MSILQNLQFLKSVWSRYARFGSKQTKKDVGWCVSGIFIRLEIEKEIGKKKAVEKRTI